MTGGKIPPDASPRSINHILRTDPRHNAVRTHHDEHHQASRRRLRFPRFSAFAANPPAAPEPEAQPAVKAAPADLQAPAPVADVQDPALKLPVDLTPADKAQTADEPQPQDGKQAPQPEKAAQPDKAGKAK